jgi:PAS domain S-box-containing protein
MLFFNISIAYTVINLLIAVIVFVKSKRSFLSKFYFICVFFIILYGVASYISEIDLLHKLNYILEPVIVFFFSLIPFFFLHFAVIFTGQYRLFQKKRMVFFIYLTGLFSYTMILLNLIPNPVKSYGGLTESGFIFYLTWMSVFFAVGISQLYHLIGGFSDKGSKSNLLLTSFAILILILPGPFAESILAAFFGKSKMWYFFTSVLALMSSVYFIFRHKSVVTSFDALRSSLEVMNDIFIKTDENFNIEIVRGAVSQQLGFEERELVGKHLSELINQKDYLESYQSFAFNGKMREGFFDSEIVTKNGELLPMNFSFSPMLSNEVITGFVGIGRNIKDRKKAEQELIDSRQNLGLQVIERTAQLAKVNEELQIDILKRKKVEEDLRILNEQLASTNASKDKFFSIVAHDLKAPFQGLLGYTSLLVDDVESMRKEELKEYLLNINEISKNIFNLVENILSWARVQLGRMEFEPTSINLKELIQDVVNVLSHNAINKKIKVIWYVEENLFIEADKKMINSVLVNLISNAIKFTKNNGLIEIYAEKVTGFVQVYVKDSGIGIRKEDQEKLFRIDASFKRDGTNEEEGTGLGLILCKELIEKHKGKIWVNSEANAGSTFYFTIPKAN